ncbi:MAG: XkdX family protein [Clostridia bacterium]|nr:XkdX family protein [Clostridia bacterium]
MTKFEKIRAYYLAGLWSYGRLKDAVLKKWLTQEEMESLVKEKEAMQ